MRFKRLAPLWLSGLWLAGFCLTGTAQASEIYSDKVKRFEVKPKVCIVKEIGAQCSMLSEVAVETTDVMKLCLMLQNDVLKCWQDRQKIKEKLALVLNGSASVDLVDEKQNRLASEQLEVNAMNSKQRRRRLRPAWSLF